MTSAELSGAQFEALVTAAAGNGRALIRLAEKAATRGDRTRAAALASEAHLAAPADPEIAALARAMRAEGIPRWHFPMIRDTLRNAAFAEAIARAVTPTSRVLDIGAGSGLLAMLAARAGAAAVTACEVNPAIAEVARDNVAANGFADRITVIAAHSTDIDPDRDMSGQADIIVSEILGADMVCEGVLPALSDAAQRLLKPGGRMIPAGGEIMVALAHSGRMDQFTMGEICGFDLSAFDRLRPTTVMLPIHDEQLSLHSEAAALFAFDFAATSHGPPRAEAKLIADGQPINGIVQWMRLSMDEHGTLETRPGAAAKSSWDCMFFPFAETVTPAAGEVVRVCGSHAGGPLRLWRG
jgi:type III protein arginine methyltransferase